MRLAQFTLADGHDTQIHINPWQVIAVQRQGSSTKISFAVVGQGGAPFYQTVTEEVEVVVHRLNSHASP